VAPSAPDFTRRRFQSAAAHYLTGRPPYPPQLITRTAQLLELCDRDRVLDLGCGPAQLAVAFAPLVREVVAMDPEPEMLALARQESKASPNVQVVAGSSADLGDHLGSFQAVLIGRAFHWMDRADTLRRLDRLIVPDGAVVLFGNDRDAAPTSDWGQAYREIIGRYAEDDDTRRHRSGGGVRTHISVLMESAFNRLEQITIIARWSFGPEVLIERALSMSSTSRARLGERTDQMVAELQAAMPTWSQDGTFTEILASTALMARRPA
jgi:SAM-dependent methyltransferase